MAVADASLRMVIDSTFSGDTSARGLDEPVMPLVSIGTPSITMRGAFDAASEAPPRIWMLPPSEGLPEVVTTTPGDAPTRRSWAEVARPASISEGLIVATDPVASLFLTTP